MKNKKGAVDETSSGETSLAIADIFHYIKIILIVGILLIYLIIPGMRYINSKAPVPDTLESDLLLERLANVCFASKHDEYDILNQKVLDISKVNEQQIKYCFGEATKNPVNSVTLTWREDSGLKNINMVLVDKVSQHKSSVPVLVKTIDGKTHPGTLELEK